jgi:hypothetical protein
LGNKMATQRKPTPMTVTKENHLEKLIPGDSFQITFDKNNRYGLFVTYEGRADGKLAVLAQSLEKPKNIVSIKIDPKNMIFSNRNYCGYAEVFITRVEEDDFKEYTPSSPEYIDKLQLLKATGGFSIPLEDKDCYFIRTG